MKCNAAREKERRCTVTTPADGNTSTPKLLTGQWCLRWRKGARGHLLDLTPLIQGRSNDRSFKTWHMAKNAENFSKLILNSEGLACIFRTCDLKMVFLPLHGQTSFDSYWEEEKAQAPTLTLARLPNVLGFAPGHTLSCCRNSSLILLPLFSSSFE